MPRIGLFYALPRHSAIFMRPPILFRRYLSWRPATLTGNIHLRSFGTAIGSRESELSIDEIDKLINKESSSLCDMIEAFIKSPEPPVWIPPRSNHEFLSNLRIPSYSNNSPNLLFHDLAVCNSGEIEEIFGQRRHQVICNSSGSGKTRRMLEGFTKYWGFYFVAVQDINLVGIPDLADALDEMGQDPQWVSDLRFVSADARACQNDLNSRIARKQLQKILAARTVVFRLFLQLAIKVDGELLEKHKRIWLLFQSQLGSVQTPHPILTIADDCLLNASPQALRILVRRIHGIRREYFPGSNFFIGLDEAQRAARLYPHAFISSTNPNKYRSIIREIAQVFSGSETNLVVSGTGLSLEDLREAMASGVSKDDVFVFHNLGMFDTWEKLQPFFERYVPASYLQSPSGYHLQKRIREYLLGRYRFSVSFLEYLLRTGLESPHKLLNEFIKRHTTCFPGDQGEAFTMNEPDLRMAINVRGFEWDRFGDDLNARRTTAEIVQSHLTLGATPTFGPVSERAVEYGVARLRDGHKGHIIEPLAFLSVMKWLETQGLDLKCNLCLRLGTQDLRGKAFEELVMLYLLRILRHPTPLSTIFVFHGARPDWADVPAQIVGRLGGIDVPVDIVGETIENPGLGVVHYAKGIQDIVDWIENLDSAPVLVPHRNFGPEFMIRCKLNSIIVILLAQLKSYTLGAKSAKIIVEALIPLREDHWFKKEPQAERQKLINALRQYPVLRFVGGYPLPPNLKSTAKSVTRAVEAFGLNVALATLHLDTFRANFISEDEAQNLLAPLNHALARRQGTLTKTSVK